MLNFRSILPNERDWIEDFSFENGKYFNTCSRCTLIFAGHKRRVVCKVCHNKGTVAPQE